MPTEVERLIKWKDAQGFGLPALAREIGMSYDGLYQALHVRRSLSATLKLHFIGRFGFDTAIEIFDMPESRPESIAQ